MQIITPEQYETTQWKGGTTRQVFISPSNGNLSTRCFNLRISSAIIEQTKSSFSNFSGFTRYILPLEGEITLLKNNKRILLSPNSLYCFEGDEVVASENTPHAIDFNIIVRHGIDVDVAIMHDAHFYNSKNTVVFALSNIQINGKPVDKHCTAILNEPFLLKGKAAIARF